MTQELRKVGHIINGPFLPLTETWLYTQVTEFESIKVKIYALYRENNEVFPFEGLRCLREDLSYYPLLFNRAWNKLFHCYPIFLFWLLKDKPDLLHAHFGPSGFCMLPFIKLLNIPLITSFYGYDAYLLPENPSWKDRYRELFDRGKLFLAEGPAMKKKLINLGCPPKKVIVHHIGIEPERYKYNPRKISDDGIIRLLIVGTFIEKKGIPYAVKAFSEVKKRINRPIHLTIVGDSNREGTLTDEKKKILVAINENNISEAITMTGYISHSELMRIAESHHIHLAPSVHASSGDAEGGFPVIITEMLATGMPILATDHCDIPEIVIDGKSGFLVPERDVDALAERLEYLVKHPEIWPEMGRYGRKFVEENYDINKLNDQLVNIYQKVAEGDFP